MIVSAVADPEAFGPAGIHDKLSRREAIGFLNGIVQNGILLDGPTKELLRASIVEADKLENVPKSCAPEVPHRLSPKAATSGGTVGGTGLGRDAALADHAGRMP